MSVTVSERKCGLAFVSVDPFTSKTASAAHIVTRFKSPGDYVSHVRNLERWHTGKREREYLNRIGRDYGGDERWSGKHSRDITETRMVTGDHKLGTAASKLRDKVSQVRVPTPKRRRVKSVIGGRACVPAYLAGAPNNMRRRKVEPSNKAPLTVTVDLTSSAAITIEQLEKRGVAVAALVSALKRSRPVNLFIVMGGFVYQQGLTNVQLIQFPTAPLDINRLVHICTDQGIPRGLSPFGMLSAGHDYAKLRGTKTLRKRKYVSWNFPFDNYAYVDTHNDAKWGSTSKGDLASDLRGYFGTDHLHIAGTVLDSADDKLLQSDPVEWINTKIAQHGATADA